MSTWSFSNRWILPDKRVNSVVKLLFNLVRYPALGRINSPEDFSLTLYDSRYSTNLNRNSSESFKRSSKLVSFSSLLHHLVNCSKAFFFWAIVWGVFPKNHNYFRYYSSFFSFGYRASNFPIYFHFREREYPEIPGKFPGNMESRSREMGMILFSEIPATKAYLPPLLKRASIDSFDVLVQLSAILSRPCLFTATKTRFQTIWRKKQFLLAVPTKPVRDSTENDRYQAFWRKNQPVSSWDADETSVRFHGKWLKSRQTSSMVVLRAQCSNPKAPTRSSGPPFRFGRWGAHRS